jgi:opacity protein-like surface antigen
MRIRGVVVLAFTPLLLPADLFAQRMRPPGIGDPWGGPTTPAPLPPQAPEIARQIAYKRLRVSMESYPLVSYVEAPGFAANSPISSWTTLGMGTRIDYRMARNLSATLDGTSSVVGGPANTQTVELGMRFRPEHLERRFYPFVDARVGYVQSYNTHAWPNDIYGNPTGYSLAQSTRFNRGFGGVAGAGFEVSLTRSFSLTSGLSVMRSHLFSFGNGVAATPLGGHEYWMTAYRYAIGLRYNPVRRMSSRSTSEGRRFPPP